MNFKYRTGTVSVKYNKMPIFSEYGTGTVLKVKRLGDRSSQKKGWLRLRHTELFQQAQFLTSNGPA